MEKHNKQILKYEKVNFKYGHKQVLSNINLEIVKGEITTIIGPNGSGKSTLIKLLTMDSNKYEGSIYLDKRIINMKEHHKHIAILFQQNYPIDELTVYEYIKYGRTSNKGLLKKLDEEDYTAIEWAINICQLRGYEEKYLGEISGGELQRVFLAWVIVRKPKILILDEPTVFLDLKYQYVILNIIRELNEKFNMTIVMVLHDIRQAFDYSHNIVMLKAGEVIGVGLRNNMLDSKLLTNLYGVNIDVINHKGKGIIRIESKNLIK